MCPDAYKSPSPWILLRLTTIISAGMARMEYEEERGMKWEKATDEEGGNEKEGAVRIREG